jgi:outer membrane protein
MMHVKTTCAFSLILTFGVGLADETALMPPPPHTAPLAGAVAAGATATQDPDQPEMKWAWREGEEVNIPLDRLGRHLPDPEVYRSDKQPDLERARRENDRTTIAYLERIFERIDTIRRPKRIHLTLEDALRRALQHSYMIEMQSYNPAVETTRVVEAEAAFDAVFFADITKNNIDRPTASQLSAADIDSFTSRYGVRKLLATGMQVSGSFGLNRTKIGAFAFQQINPEYTADFVMEMRQPLLRGFGVDFNRSQITVAQNVREISQWAFRRQVRDTLRLAEELYWRLLQARRDVAISARLLADFEAIYTYLEARKEFDVIPVQLNATKANLEQSRAEFIRRRANVFGAEDRLIAVMNDPEIPLGAGIEIIPDDLPQLSRIVVDSLAEVQAALENRPEIKEQELGIANAKVAVGQAKNLELPRLDLTLQTTFDGLSGTADRAVDELSRRKFVSYFIGVEFEVPIGNRGARAAHRRAQLQYAQGEASLKALFEEVIRDVHLAIRELNTSYDQIGPSFESAEARVREVESTVARAERKDLATLNSELSARSSLAAERRAMLNAMVNYNVAIIELERAKGTLLQYNNVVVPTEPE